MLDFSARRELYDVAMRRQGRIRYVAGVARNDLGVVAVLVRPDGIVAWVGERVPDSEAFDQAVGQWFG